MKIRIGYEIGFSVPQPTPMVLMLSVRPELSGLLSQPDLVNSSSGLTVFKYLDLYGNQCSRVTLQPGSTTLWTDTTIIDSGLPDTFEPNAPQNEIQDLPPGVLHFLLASRYCETEALSEFAWQNFGHILGGWQKVQAIVDYVHRHLTFGYGYARNTRTAYQAWQERVGVCRDFAHLALTLCRCVNIPARYCTGYLGDIGVPVNPAPMDFSGWFEVYLGTKWYAFDARHNEPRIGRIQMAHGRDAADVAISTAFGPNILEKFNVQTYEV